MHDFLWKLSIKTNSQGPKALILETVCRRTPSTALWWWTLKPPTDWQCVAYRPRINISCIIGLLNYRVTVICIKKNSNKWEHVVIKSTWSHTYISMQLLPLLCWNIKIYFHIYHFIRTMVYDKCWDFYAMCSSSTNCCDTVPHNIKMKERRICSCLISSWVLSFC